MKSIIKVKYVNIDDWNRPVFKDDKGNYYGSTDKLFPYEETEKKVLETVTAEDLVYFGSTFNCEPFGSAVKGLTIVPARPRKGLLVDVMGIDCTNHGITSGKKGAILIFPGCPEIFEETEEHPALQLVKGAGGREHVAVPADAKNRGMFGGQFVYSSDSRFPDDQPIHVHDRYE